MAVGLVGVAGWLLVLLVGALVITRRKRARASLERELAAAAKVHARWGRTFAAVERDRNGGGHAGH